MRYVSTRQKVPDVGIGRAILDGIAPDGGLYVPSGVPVFGAQALASLADASMDKLAFVILKKFVADEVSDAILGGIIAKAYGSFAHPSVTPMVEIGHNRWIMELFHGPTLAFKDLALQVLAPLMDYLLKAENRDAFILCATSGDTGGAALSAFGGVERVKALVLYPSGAISEFQESQMLHLASRRCQTASVEGTFDDCQHIVKSLLSNRSVADQFGLTAVNSVNWGRIMAQSVYYAKASLAHGNSDRPVNFVVPTGNFGNAYAGILAKRMGFPVGKITVATNANDTLHRAIDGGVFEPGATIGTNTPAMDIQAPSNFERMVFDVDRSPDKTESLRFFETLKQEGKARVPEQALGDIRKDVVTRMISTLETERQLHHTYAQTGYVADPHTALALAAAQTAKGKAPTVVLATAHPVKFSQIVTAALGQKTAISAYRGAAFDITSNPSLLAATQDAVLKRIAKIASGAQTAG